MYFLKNSMFWMIRVTGSGEESDNHIKNYGKASYFNEISKKLIKVVNEMYKVVSGNVLDGCVIRLNKALDNFG